LRPTIVGKGLLTRRLSLSVPSLAIVLSILIVASCDSDREVVGPGSTPIVGSAIRLLVDVRAGRVTVAPPPASTVAIKDESIAPSFALIGQHEIGVATSNFFRSAVGQFTPHRVRVRFDIALTNKLLNADLVPSTFPPPPSGVSEVIAFPFATDPSGLFGLRVRASSDWDGTGAAESGSPHNFFNDANCNGLTPPGDCFRWEAFGATIEPGATTAARTVGFDVDFRMDQFTVYVVVAADINERPLPTPAIEALRPTSGFLGTTVIIEGTGFAAALADNIVEFVPMSGAGSIQLPVTRVTPQSETALLTASLPSSPTVLPVGVYRARVIVSGRASALSGTTFERLLTWLVTTLAGSGPGFADGVGTTAQFLEPAGLAMAADGTLLVADRLNHRIRRIDHVTAAVTTVAGDGTAGFADGVGSVARFNFPSGVAVAADGSVYVVDTQNHRIRRINPATGVVTTVAGDGTAGFADGIGSAARFNFPTGLAAAEDGTLYVADPSNERLRRIDPGTGAVTTIRQFVGSSPLAVAVAPNGTVYLALVNEAQGGWILQLDPTTGVTSDLAVGSLGFPAGVTVTPDDRLFVTDQVDHRIRQFDIATGALTILAGTGMAGFADGVGPTAQFAGPFGVTVGANGTLFVADRGNNRIRRIQVEGF